MIAAIEQAMAARVQAASDAGTLGYTLRTIGTLPVRFNAELVARFAKQFPALWFVYAGRSQPQERGPNEWYADRRFVAVCAARNLRNEEAQRHGGGDGQPGSYQLLEDVEQLLAGQSLGLSITPIRPGSHDPLFSGEVQDKQMSLFGLELFTGYTYETADDVAALDDFTLFHGDWDMAVPDGQIDATDDVTLEAPV